MLEPYHELSGDLEWMLGSGQVEQGVLAGTLLREHYAGVYRLALALLDDPQEATRAARDSISAALLRVYNFRSQDGVQVWLYRIVEQTLRGRQKNLRLWRGLRAVLPGRKSWAGQGVTEPADEREARLWLAVDALAYRMRLVVLLSWVLGWAEGEIAALLGCAEAVVVRQLQDARYHLVQSLARGFPGLEAPTLLDRQPLSGSQMAALMRKRWPAPHLSGEALEQVREQVLASSRRRAVLQFRLQAAKEVLLIGGVIGLVAVGLWSANRLIPESQGEQLAQATARANRLAAFTPRTRATSTPMVNQRVFSHEMLTYVVQPGDSLESIAARVGMSLEDLRALNGIESSAALRIGRTLLIRVGLTPPAPFTPTPVLPAPKGEALTTATNPEHVIKRMANSGDHWHTLWADILLIDDGPAGYVGPPRATRVQVWAAQPRRSLEIIGPWGGSPDLVYTTNNFRGFEIKPLSGGISSFATAELLHDLPVRDMLFPGRSPWFVRMGTFSIAGEEQVAGRPTLLMRWVELEGVKQALFNVDIETGVILAQTVYDESGRTVISRSRVNAIAYDVDFPEQIFELRNLWRLEFAADESGRPLGAGPMPAIEPAAGHQRLLAAKIPLGYDLSRSRLTFEYPQDMPPDEPFPEVQVLVDGYSLGRIPFGNPWTSICVRSPDGLKLAYVSQPGPYQGSVSALHWINLGHPGQAQEFSSPLEVTNFAIAPDSQHLAVFGRNTIFSHGEVSILDTQTGELRSILSLIDAKSFVWSPDGEYLALIASVRTRLLEEVVVLRAGTGQVVYRSPIDLQSGREGQDWPMLEWKLPFPVEMGGIGDCAQPGS